MMWFAIAATVVVLVLGVVLVARSRGRNSGAARARDVGPVNTANVDAHGAATQHQGNLHGGGGLGF
ncbi:MAG: hypothetical protein WKF50_06770 [Nocardioides sp.]